MDDSVSVVLLAAHAQHAFSKGLSAVSFSPFQVIDNLIIYRLDKGIYAEEQHPQGKL